MMDEREKKKKASETDRLKSVAKYNIVIGTVFVLVTLAIWYKVFNTMINEGPKWRAIAKNLRPPREVPISPIRGNIYSSDNKLLAISPPYYRIFFDFQSQSIALLQHKGLLIERLDSLASLAIESFSSCTMSKKELLRYWQRGLDRKSRHWDLLQQQASFLEYEQFMNAPMMYIKGERGKRSRSSVYRSLYSEKVSRRQKPYGELVSATIGNVYGTPDSSGLAHGSGGLELAYDSLLIGKPGIAKIGYIGGRNTSTILQEPISGANLYTTFSVDTQREVHKILKKRLSELKAARGTALVMEASTGRIVAMANLQFRGGDSTNYTETYPIAFNDLMEPGSTFKAATMMALLDDGYITPESTFDVGNGVWGYGGAKIEDGRKSRGVITYARALALSSNIVPAASVVKYYGENPQRYINKVKSFGFGEDLHLELPGYQTARIKDTSASSWSKISLPWIAHGYETQIPPVMMLTFFNAIANGGTIYRPFIVDSIVSPKGDMIYKGEPTIIKDSICKPSTILALRGMLRGVVTEGTGKIVNSPHVEICGKSGTAQIAQGKYGYRGAGKTHSVTFIGFFPYKNPRYTCLVNIISPRKDMYPAGGAMSGPVVRDIAEYLILSSQRIDVDKMPSLSKEAKEDLGRLHATLLAKEGSQVAQRLNIKMQKPEKTKEDEIIKLQAKGDNELVATPVPLYAKGTMPLFIGLSASTAAYLGMQHGLKLKIRGSGEVFSQSIPAGQPIKVGQEVHLFLKRQ